MFHVYTLISRRHGNPKNEVISSLLINVNIRKLNENSF